MNPSPMNASESPAERLALLVHLSQVFNSSLDLEEVLNRVMDEVIIATRAERGFVVLAAPGNPDAALEFRAARGIDQQTLDDPQFQVSRSIVDRVLQAGEPVLTSDAQADARFMLRQSVVSLGLRAILCVPLRLQERILGAVYVDNRFQSGIFTPADQELLSAIASPAATAIENARLYLLAVEQGRLERELQVARQVQAGLLPRHAPQVPGWEFAARWLPARQVAGDYYDFVVGSAGEVGVIVADVTDKGMPAALFMAMVRSTVRASLAQSTSPAAAIAQANRLIAGDAESGMFVTLIYAALNPLSGQAVYVNAGHNPPVVCRPATGEIHYWTRTGMALGVMPNVEFSQKAEHLEPGDFILFYTDGITEALSPAGEEFGLERLEALLRSQAGQSPEAIAIALEAALAEFTGLRGGGPPPHDDITFVLARRLNLPG